ncbi:ABC transporter permease [Xanthobacter sp. V4C-4]|uniref:ABC transporter permease n=1 Tax=Xanthobacter cornucopiae TaxID=3119924 RepID=UPI0037264DCF
MSLAPLHPAAPPPLAVARALLRRSLAGLGRVPLGPAVAALVVAVYLVAALAPDLLQTHGPFKIDLKAILLPPSPDHWFGTDQTGRDLYSRVIAGAGQSLALGLAATALSLAIALAFGLTAGLAGGDVDLVIARFLDVLFSFPTLFLALLFLAVFGTSITTQVVAVGVGTAPGYARMIRGQVLAVKGAGYVEAARVLGHPPWRIALRHIVPNALRPLVVLMTLGVGQSIVWASGLAFLGLGVAPPSPEWGALLDAGRNYAIRAWWLELMPGLAIVGFALAVTVLGRHLRDRLEGK